MLPRDATTQQAVSAAEEFAAAVGELSQCAARVTVDLLDEGDAMWPADRGVAVGKAGEFPDDALAFRGAGDYDHGFYRHPGTPDCGGSTNMIDAEFPVSASGEGCGVTGTPWSMLLLHEWLHTVVGAHPKVDWPTNDVHGGCEHGYTESPCYVNRRYFGDMMTGRVPEAGRLMGIQPRQWRLVPSLSLYVNAGGDVSYSVTPTAPAQIVIQRRGAPAIAIDAPNGDGALPQPLPAGRYRVCLLAGNGRHHHGGETCVNPIVYGKVRLRLAKATSGRYVTLSTEPAGIGQQARVTIRRLTRQCGSCAYSPAARARKRTLTLRARQRISMPRTRQNTRYQVAVAVASFEREGVPYRVKSIKRTYR